MNSIPDCTSCVGETVIKLEPKAFDLLTYLLEHRDRVVPRQELFEHVWPQQFVSDDALERCLGQVRRAVGDNGGRQRIIKTLRGRRPHRGGS